MEDAIRPTKQVFKAMYERGFRTWYSLYEMTLAETDSSHPWQTCPFEAENPILSYPPFPPNLILDKSFSNTILARGQTIWGTTSAATEQINCDRGLDSNLDLPSFKKNFTIQVAADRPVILDIWETQNGCSGCEFWECWHMGGEENGEKVHIAVLVLAWTYILSARWAEIIPGVHGIEYSDFQVQWRNEEMSTGETVVDLGDVDDGAARWWAAVLAANGGWSATILNDKGNTLHSPWYTKIESKRSLTLSRDSGPFEFPPHSSPVSFVTALSYLSSYIEYHNVAEQSHAALGAASLVPVARWENRRVILPIPRTLQKSQPGPNIIDISKASKCRSDPKRLDNLLTLSCNVLGIKSLLNSIFFEPGVESNICGAWLQGTFEFFDSDALHDENENALFRVLVKRDPALAFLWLGAFMTGAQKRALQEARQGWWKIGLNTAAWTGRLFPLYKSQLQNRVIGMSLDPGLG
ncbi:hypothetical protein IFR05_015557 [Cadophora sp. M221]|nr:hypothetical protein IFR05_015557 [Cadophora sp. M221]